MFPSNTIPLQQHPAVPDFAAPRTTIADALRSQPPAKVPTLRKLLSGTGSARLPHLSAISAAQLVHLTRIVSLL